MCVLSFCMCKKFKINECQSCLKKSKKSNNNNLECTNPLLQTNFDDTPNSDELDFYRTRIRNYELKRFGLAEHEIRKRSPSPETLFPLRKTKDKSKKLRITKC